MSACIVIIAALCAVKSYAVRYVQHKGVSLAKLVTVFDTPTLHVTALHVPTLSIYQICICCALYRLGV